MTTFTLSHQTSGDPIATIYGHPFVLHTWAKLGCSRPHSLCRKLCALLDRDCCVRVQNWLKCDAALDCLEYDVAMVTESYQHPTTTLSLRTYTPLA